LSSLAVVTRRSMKSGRRSLDAIFTVRHCLQPTLSLSLVSTRAPPPCLSLTNHAIKTASCMHTYLAVCVLEEARLQSALLYCIASTFC
jgi:hypothetical protein